MLRIPSGLCCDIILSSAFVILLHSSAAADDYGHLISRSPLAILYPGSVDDVVTMMHFARRFRLRIVGRGNGHTAFGQAQVEGGLVIDLGSLRQIHAVTADRTVVDAGVVRPDRAGHHPADSGLRTRPNAPLVLPRRTDDAG
ncbi:FAD-binding protein [Spirosoma pollinicola]|uniref:FAD-binding protein n=1 Tax=Spirosoma pollinicola TaxID=2057025 RepID=UPI0012FE45A1|nr:FAD-binding protein [Spirosoma pollinicola]